MQAPREVRGSGTVPQFVVMNLFCLSGTLV